LRIVIPNAVVIEGDPSEPPVEEGVDDVVAIRQKHAARVGSTRSPGGPLVVDVGEDDIVEMTFEDNSRWFLDRAELSRLHRGRADVSRGAPPIDGEIIIDDTLFPDERSRGLVGQALLKLRVLVVTLARRIEHIADDRSDGADDASLGGPLQSLIIDPIASGIARRLERRLIENGASRLCRVSFEQDEAGALALRLETLASMPDPGESSGRVLLLLHGTLSSTQGSFGDLWDTRPDEIARLREHFGERIYAFEHCTLSESPVQNALQLAQTLPPSIELHLLSHSRGGLVGELLCRGTRDGIDAFSSDELKMFQVQRDAARVSASGSGIDRRALQRHHARELDRLKALNQALSERGLRIARFVRVGCPARGTTLASGRLHRWSNRSLNAIGRVSGQTLNPLYRAFEAFTLGMLKANARPDVLPGLQAQMPDSALVHVLNHGDTPLVADLAVVAGDLNAAGGLNWKRIPVWFTDRFYGGQNDLVVNTASMDGGSARKHGIRELRVAGEHVNHFSYFANADSCGQLVSYLIGLRTPRFRTIQRNDEVVIARGGPPEHTGDRPVLVLVPGILGSELKLRGKRVWAHPSRLLRGRITDLHIGADNVRASAVMDRAYGAFVQEFCKSHDVHVAPYDWRRSLGESAESLSALIMGIVDAQVADNRIQPIRIVAHSMGGLVTRTLMATRPDTWQRVCERPGSRFIMAGTPTNGSYAINQLVCGELDTIRLLALADLKNTRRDITDLAAAFPGVATMLPGFGELDWLHESIWQEIDAGAANPDWSPIAAPLIKAARNERRRLLDTPLDPALVTYVAGQADRTPSDAFFDPSRGGRIRFHSTPSGDGQVTWEHGIPANLTNVYYQPSAHGSLLAAPKHFAAWAELLDSGRTTTLSRHAPEVSGARGADGFETPQILESDAIDYLPDADTLLEMALGMEPGERDASPPAGSFTVKIAHGDLAFAHHPVAVGHYAGEPIVGGEAALDRVLDYRLTERHLIGQYPGNIGTGAIVFAPSRRDYPEGALVVGLGEIGELSAGMLQRSLTAAFTDYLLEMRDWWAMRPDEDRTPEGAKLSSLLIGTGIAALPVRDSVGAILRAVVAANRACAQASVANVQLIRELVLIEQWQDLALQAADAATSWSKLLPEVDVFEELIESSGGRRRSHFQANNDWWHSISIRQGDSADEYVFDDYTRSARNELTREPIDRKFIDRFVDQIINTTRTKRGAQAGPQRALFELLLPRGIKRQAPDSDKLRLILDEHTAHIPWEMLIDGWAPGDTPLVVSRQVIRRLALEQFRDSPELARGHRVLIVGDPPSGDDPYPVLPGARREAQRVVETYESRQPFEVVPLIADERTPSDGTDLALAIVQALCSDAFRILHFAGHGSYHREGSERAEDDAEQEGMIIGEGLRLTPTLISKMRKTPSLVFLNCCHLGLVEQRSAHGRVRFNRIAANLATQFIRMGSRAVVAAGWEVDDSAAEHFAAVFHERMAGNATLAEAIHAARLSTHDKHADRNTFGAYQCWGDPEFRLDPIGRLRDARTGLVRYASPHRYTLEAANLCNDALTASEPRRASLDASAKRLLASMIDQYGDPWHSPDRRDRAWHAERVRALAGLGRAFGELGELPSAIRLLRVAYRLDASALSVKDLEQLGSFECQYAVFLPEDADARDEFGTQKQLLTTGRRRLASVLEQHRNSGQLYGQRTILCLVARGAKREAMLLRKTSTVGLRRALLEMRHYYGIGWSGEQVEANEATTLQTYIRLAALNREPPNDYAFGNFALACIVLRWHDEQATRWPDAFVDLVREYTTSALAQKERAGDFWMATRGMQSLMLPYLDTELADAVGFPGNASTPEEVIALVDAQFTTVDRRFGSVRQWATIEDHLRFVADMLDKKPGGQDESMDRARAEGIARITERVRVLKRT